MSAVEKHGGFLLPKGDKEHMNPDGAQLSQSESLTESVRILYVRVKEQEYGERYIQRSEN